MAAIGLGLGGFFAGLAVGDAAMGWLGVDGSKLKDMMVNLGEGLSAFSGNSLVALGALFAAGALFGAVAGPGKSLKAAVGMTSVGAGIGGFFAGLALSDAAMSFLNVDGSKLKDMMKNLAEGMGAFSDGGLVALGALFAAGALFGTVGGAGTALKVGLGMTMVGAGIGGFFAGLALGDAAMGWLDVDGSRLKDMMKNLAEGLGAFSDGQLVGLAALLGAGALFGAVPGIGMAMAGGAAVGMTAIGAGLGGFFLGLGTGEKIMKAFGMDGSGIKVMMINLAEGLNSFAGIDGENLLKAGEGLSALAGGLAKMAGAGLVNAGASFFSDIFSALTFWKDDEDPTEKFKVYTKLAKHSEDFKKVGEGLSALGAGLVAFATGAKEISKVKSIDLSSLDTIDAEKIRVAAEKLAPIKGVGQDLMAIRSLSSENEITKISSGTPGVNVVDTSSNITNVTSNKNVIGRNPVKNSDTSLRNYNNNSSLQFVH